LGVEWSSIGRTVEFFERLDARGPRAVKPAEFPHLVPSAAAGNVSIYHGLTGPVVTAAAGPSSGGAAVALAVDLLELGLAGRVVAGATSDYEPLLADPNSEGSVWVALSAVERASSPRQGTLARLEFVRFVPCRVEPPFDLASPSAPDRARVLFSSAAPAPLRQLASTSWSGVAVDCLEPAVGARSTAGAMALACAAGLIASGDLDRILVVDPDERGAFWFMLGSLDPSR
jgi:hypothetical protein